MPQPNFVPVMPSTSRNTQSSGVSPSTSTLCVVPLTLMVKAMASLLPLFHQALGDVDDGFGEGLRRFLRQIVADAARDGPVLIFAGEFLGVGAGLRVRRAVGVAFQRDGRHGDDRECGEPLFQIVIFRLAFSQTEPPAVIVDRRWRRDPDCRRPPRCDRTWHRRTSISAKRVCQMSLAKVVPVFLVAGAAALGGEIKLVPPFELGLRRQRHLAGFLAADQIAAHGDHGLAALRPKRRDDVGGPRAPVEAGEDRLLDLERIHQGDDIDSERRRLAVADRFAREKARRAIAAQIGNDHPVAGRRQQRRDIDKAVNVVGPAVQKNDRAAHRRGRPRRSRYSGRRHRSASAARTTCVVPGLIAGSRACLCARLRCAEPIMPS